MPLFCTAKWTQSRYFFLQMPRDYIIFGFKNKAESIDILESREWNKKLVVHKIGLRGYIPLYLCVSEWISKSVGYKDVQE